MIRTRFNITSVLLLYLFSCTTKGLSPADKLLVVYDSVFINQPHQQNIEQLNSILKLAEKEKDLETQANCCRRLGIVFSRQGNLILSTQYYLKATILSDSAGEILSQASNQNQLGVNYYHLNQFDSALIWFKKAFNSYSLCSDTNGVCLMGKADAGGNVADIYGAFDSIDLMYKYSLLSLEARYKGKDTLNLLSNFHVIATFFDKKNENDSAFAYYELAKKQLNYNSDSSYTVQLYNSIGKLYLKLNLLDSADYYFQLANSPSYSDKNIAEKHNTLYNLSALLERKGYSKKAFDFYKEARSFEDSLRDVEIRKNIDELNIRYNAQTNSRVITEQAQHIKIQYLWLVIITIVSVAIVVIAILLVWSYRNKRRLAQNETELHRSRIDDLLQKQEVENVNAQLKGQDEERKRIAQELHDRIGSILSTVKLHFSNVEEGMKVLKEQQNKSYTEATNLLDEAVDEVRRISHDLYEGSLARFGFKTALLQLIAAVEKANIIKITFIDNGIDMQAYKTIEQDLYRITQELLSNTLKYAGAKEITIQLAMKDTTFTYMYEDDGKGFDKNLVETSPGIGYKNINARVAKMNGEWHLDSQPGHGMTLLIEIPG